MREETTTVDDRTFLFDADVIGADQLVAIFDQTSGTTVGHSKQGRGTVRFIEQGDLEMVLREYRRGGLIGKLVSTAYLYLGFDRTRMAREFRLLAHLTEHGMPVPQPLAVQVSRSGPIYRGSLLTRRLPVQRTLAETLAFTALDADGWASIGRCIRDFHNHGVYHADLNANNIMLDTSRIYLIDFDRGRLRSPSQVSWRQANLERLHRSLTKIQGNVPEFHFEAACWQHLMAGYQSDSGDNATQAS